jgi:Ca2+-binding RTX toxin-like protein
MTALGTSGRFAAGDARFFAAAGASSGHDADDRIVYNTTTGQLFYDADGNGAGAAQLVATLQGAPTLAATSILVTGQAQPSNQPTAGDDSLTGTEGNDSINGLAGNDTINALGGNDTIDGGSGADVMIGGAGDDLYFVDNSSDAVVESQNGGVDEVRVSVDQYTMSEFVNNGTLVGSQVTSLFGNAADNFMTASSVTQGVQLDGITGNDTLIGGSAGDELNGWQGNDSMVGGEGNDTFDGFNHPQDGADTMVGGTGDDIYFVDSAADVTVEESGGGLDTVNASVSYTLGAFVNNLTLLEVGAINGTGNDMDNVITGNSAVNSLNGGLGNDTYVVSAGDVLSDSGGIDTVQANITWALADGFENLTLTGTGNINATGNNAANVLTGNSGNNFFNPRGGDDTIQGGAGNDQVTLGGGGVPTYGNKVIDLGAGFDRLDFSGFARSAIQVDLAAGTLKGGGDAGQGSATLSGIENVVGDGFNDRLSGSAVAESLNGGGGNDTIDGRGGNDTLTGGTGADAFVFDTGPAAGNVDQVTDFVSATDRLNFDNATFTALGADGNFAAGDARFAAGAGFTSGRDASDRIVYDTTTGNLYYDADGSGAGAAQLVATLQGHPALAATDIAVI